MIQIKKVLVVSGMIAAMLTSAVPAFAAGKAAPKATGGIGYTAYTTTQRHAEFNAIETATTCSNVWDITGTFVFAFKLDPDTVTTYSHDAFLTQTGSAVTGNGGYPVGGPYAYSWHVTSGTVTGNDVSLSIVYDTGAPGTVMTMTGTIAPDGTMTGTWTDDFGGTRTGTWASTAGAASKTYGTGCDGKGVFNYSDADGNFYQVRVQYFEVSGDDAWFAGPVVSGNVGAGSWLFAKVHDGSEPGTEVDQVWGSFTTEAAAKTGVALMSTPLDGPFTITSGNLQVH